MPNDGGKTARQGRSPAYPFIPLRKALDRAEEFRKAEGRHAAPPTSAYRSWELSIKGNVARQTTAALKYYGLMEYEGRGAARQVKLTDLAFKILLDKRPESSERDGLIREAALTPTIFSEMWREWGPDLPSDATIQTFLLLKQGFSESAAPDVITVYKDTLGFGKLNQPDIMSGNGDDLEDIEWDQTEEQTGVPEGEGSHNITVPAAKGPAGVPKRKPALGIVEATLPLEEGQAILRWPDKLSQNSYQDFEDWVGLMLRRAKRSIIESDSG